jgi:CRP/FNR family transcriptional regulator, cyclic AMP receptor protein
VSTLDLPSRHRVRLLQADRDLAEAIPEEDRLAARRLIVSDAQRLARGPWKPDVVCEDGTQGFALVIVEGLVLREVLLAGRRAAQVYGPGDMVRPVASGDSSLSEVVEWTVMDDALVTVLDNRFLAAARRWPRLGAAVNDRLFAQADRVAVHLAIAQLPRIEQRLLAMLWHLADRFGHVTTAGVVVPFALTHDALGRLVGARRPTVSLGLSALGETGTIGRRADGRWVLDPESRALLLAPMPPTPPVDVERTRLRLVAGSGR